MATLVDDSVAGRGYGGVAYGGDNGILSAMLLAGLMGRRDDRKDDCIADQLNSVADGINHNINTALIGLTNQLNSGFGGQRDLDLMQKLGNIEGDIWKAEGEVQLAIAGAEASITDKVTQGTLSNLAGQAVINKNINDAEAAILQSLCGIEKTVLTTSALNLSATKDAQYAVTTAVRDDGDKTRAKIDFYHDQDMQRKLTVAESALAEERGSRRIRDVEVSMSQTVNQTNSQAQLQTQQQQQLQLMAGLLAEVRNLANDVQVVRQTQSNVNFGTQTGTAQTASAANNRVG